MTKKVWFKNSRGQKLAGILHTPQKFKGKKPAGVVICHGHHDSKDRRHLSKMAFALERAGLMVLRFDLSGNGESEGIFKTETYTRYIKDFKSAIDFIADKGIKRIGVIGHSMAGPILLEEKVNDNRVHCIGILNPCVHLKKTHYRDFTKKDYKRLKEKGYFSYVSIYSGKEYFTYKPFFDDLKNHNPIRAAKQITCPVIIYQGTKDKSIPVNHSKDLLKVLLTEVKFLKLIKGDHNFRDKKSEKEVVDDIVYWFSKYLHYRSPVINAFVQHKGKILLLKRSQEVGTHRGMWNCVGGYIKSDLQSNGELKVKESPAKRARHEIEEELGIKKEDLKLIDQAEPVDWVDDTSDKIWRIHYFLFESKTNKVKLDWEHTEFRWVKPSQIKKYKNIIGLEPNLKRLMKKI